MKTVPDHLRKIRGHLLYLGIFVVLYIIVFFPNNLDFSSFWTYVNLMVFSLIMILLFRINIMIRDKNFELEISRRAEGTDSRVTKTAGHDTAVHSGEKEQVNRILLKSNHALRILSLCNRIIFSGTDLTAIFNEVCHKIVQYGGYRMAIIGYFDPENKIKIKPLALAGLDPDFLEIPDFAMWCENSFFNPDTFTLVLPLQGKTGQFGHLGIYAGEINSFVKEEILILEELAVNLSLKIASF